MTIKNIPLYCQCGCNEQFIPRHPERNVRYKRYHHLRVLKKTENHKLKLGLSKLGEKNPMWKGDNVSYGAIHEYMRNHLPKPDLCERCHENPPYDLANKSGIYLREVDDWQWLCRKCHMLSDGRMEIFIHSDRGRR